MLKKNLDIGRICDILKNNYKMIINTYKYYSSFYEDYTVCFGISYSTM